MTGLIAAAYLGTIVLANWLITVFGVVPLGCCRPPGPMPLVWRHPGDPSMTGWAHVGPSA